MFSNPPSILTKCGLIVELYEPFLFEIHQSTLFEKMNGVQKLLLSLFRNKETLFSFPDYLMPDDMQEKTTNLFDNDKDNTLRLSTEGLYMHSQLEFIIVWLVENSISVEEAIS